MEKESSKEEVMSNIRFPRSGNSKTLMLGREYSEVRVSGKLAQQNSSQVATTIPTKPLIEKLSQGTAH